jgi:hypothetical protein
VVPPAERSATGSAGPAAAMNALSLSWAPEGFMFNCCFLLGDSVALVETGEELNETIFLINVCEGLYSNCSFNRAAKGGPCWFNHEKKHSPQLFLFLQVKIDCFVTLFPVVFFCSSEFSSGQFCTHTCSKKLLPFILFIRTLMLFYYYLLLL